MRREFVVPLPIELDRSGEQSLPSQLADSIRQLATSGQLRPGDHLPSTRALAQRLEISRGTVVTAYEQLTAEGYLLAAHGSGTRLNPEFIQNPPIRQRLAPPSAPPTQTISLLPGRPYTEDLADAAWRSAWRRACSQPVPSPQDRLGLWELRIQVAEHLRRMRSIFVDPSLIAITAGSREGLALTLLCIKALTAQSQPSRTLTIGVESPGYPSLRRVPQRLGHQVLNLPTDSQGVNPTKFPAQGLDAVLITPNHQYPFGTTLPAPRRSLLMSWAQNSGALIIEDDFDSELRYVGFPFPPVTSDANTRGVLLGTFSSVISPDLSCGYAVLPPEFVDHARKLRADLGSPVAAMTQRALAYYMESGALRRRTQRLRREYRRRQELVTRYLTDIPGARLHPISGGLHAVVESDREEDEIVRKLSARGIGVRRLSQYWGGSGTARGIVFGFGNVGKKDLEQSLVAIAHECSVA